MPTTPPATSLPGDSPPVVAAIRAFNSGLLSEEGLFRVVLAHPTWHVPVDDQSRALLWTFDGQKHLAAMREQIAPDGQACRFMPMRAIHLAQNCPEDAHRVVFDLSQPHSVAMGRTGLAALVDFASTQAIEDLFDDRTRGDPACLLDHEWLVLCRDGSPAADLHRGQMAIRLFTAPRTLERYLVREPQHRALDVRRMKGSDFFAHLTERTDFDAVWFNAHRQDERDWPAFGPSIAYDLLEGRDPRPEARILRARTVAEIHHFLDEQGMSREDRQHQLEYVGDTLVAHYFGPIIGHPQRSFRFFPVEPASDPLSFGPGKTEILCAGKLADLVRRRVADFGQPDYATWEGYPAYAAVAVRWTDELVKLLEPDLDTLPRRTMRTFDGARFVREYPEIATRSWIVAAGDRARRIAGVATPVTHPDRDDARR